MVCLYSYYNLFIYRSLSDALLRQRSRMLGERYRSPRMRLPTNMSISQKTYLWYRWHGVRKSLRAASGRLYPKPTDCFSENKTMLNCIASNTYVPFAYPRYFWLPVNINHDTIYNIVRTNRTASTGILLPSSKPV